MFKKKSVFWFVVWAVLLIAGSLYSGIREISYYFKTGTYLEHPPFADYQIFLFFVFLPFFLIPALCLSHHYARKEKSKAIRIATIFLIIQHAICLVAFAFQLI